MIVPSLRIPTNSATESEGARANWPRTLGQWNQTRIVARGKHVEHWLNGEKLLEYDVDSELWRAHVKTSKYFQAAYGQGNWGRAPKGHIALQDYGGAIEFRSIKIRPAGP